MATRRAVGQAVAELALLLPLMLFILLGCLDLGRAFSAWLTLTNGAREGARYAASHPEKTDMEILAFARDDIVAEGLDGDALQLEISPGLAGREGGSPVTVTARYTLPLITLGLFDGQPLTLRASSQMMVLKGGR